jgi:hypothetical protein
MADYYIIGGDGKEYGPYPPEKIRELLSESRLEPATKIRTEEEPWTTVGDLSEFSPITNQPHPPPINPPSIGGAGYPVQPYSSSTDLPRSGPPTNQLAVTGMVLGISSFVLSCCCSQFPFLGLIALLISFLTPIAGLICSIIARSQIRKSNGTQGGEGIAMAGIIISSVYLLLIIAIIALVVAGVVAAGKFGRP